MNAAYGKPNLWEEADPDIPILKPSQNGVREAELSATAVSEFALTFEAAIQGQALSAVKIRSASQYL